MSGDHDDADMEVEETTEPAPLQATGDSGAGNDSMMEGRRRPPS